MTRKALTTPADVPDVVAAASIALAVMQAVGAEQWREVVDDVATVKPKVGLTSEQVALVQEHFGPLHMLRITQAGTASIAACPACGRFQVATSSVTKCVLTIGCAGKPVRAKPAKPAR